MVLADEPGVGVPCVVVGGDHGPAVQHHVGGPELQVQFARDGGRAHGRLGPGRYVERLAAASVRPGEQQEVPLPGQPVVEQRAGHRGEVEGCDEDVAHLPLHVQGQRRRPSDVTDHPVAGPDALRRLLLEVHGRLHAPQQAGDGVVGHPVPPGEGPEGTAAGRLPHGIAGGADCAVPVAHEFAF